MEALITWPSDIDVPTWLDAWSKTAQFKNIYFESGFSLSNSFITFIEQNPKILTTLDKNKINQLLTVEVKLTSQILAPTSERVIIRQQKHLERRFKKLIMFDDIFTKIISLVDDNPSGNTAIVRLLLEITTNQKDKKLLNQNLDKFVKFYMTLVITARSPPISLCNIFNTLISNLPHDTFKDTILPEIVKQMKRNPNTVIHTVAHLLDHLNLDMSHYVTTIIEMISEQIQSQDVTIQKAALHILDKVTEQTTDSEAMKQVVELACKPLLGFVQQVQGRIGVASSLSILSHKQLGVHTNTLTTQVVEKLVKLIKKESILEALQNHLIALGDWINLLNEIPKNALELYTTFLKDSKKPERFKLVLLSLNHSIDKIDNKGIQLFGLANLLVDIIIKVKQKPTTRVEALLALRILTKLAPVVTDFFKLAENEKIWQFVFSSSSFLFTTEFVSRIDDIAFPSLVSFIELVIVHHFSKIADCPDFFGMVISAMTKVKWPMLKMMIDTIVPCIQKNTHLSNLLFQSFVIYIEELTKQSPDEEKLRGLRSINANTLYAIVSKDLSLDFIPSLVIVSHHPAVALPKVSGVLRKIVRKMEIDIEKVIEERKDSVIKHIMSEQGLNHPYKLGRLAATNALCGLVRIIKNIIMVHDIIRPMENFFEDCPDKWFNLSSEELGIFHTPEGEVWAVDKIAITTSTDKGGKKTADQQWEEEIRAKQLEKQGILQKEAQTKKEKVLQEEQVIRNRVRSIYDKLITGIEAVVSLSITDPVAIEECLFVLLPIFLRLLKSNDFDMIIERNLMTIARKSFPSHIGQSVATTLYTSFCQKKLPQDTIFENYSSIIEKLRNFMTDVLEGHQYALVLPIICDILLNNYPESLQDIALYFLEHHSSLYKSTDVLRTAIYVIGNSELFMKRAKDALILYCSRLDGVKYYDNVLVLLDGIISKFSLVRLSCLEGLNKIWNINDPELSTKLLISRVWFSKQDSTKEIVDCGNILYDKLAEKIEKDYLDQFLPILGNLDQTVRTITAKAIAQAIILYPDTLTETESRLFAYYSSHLPDENQKKYEQELTTMWSYYRNGVALTISECSNISHSAPQIAAVFKFLIYTALFDSDESVLGEFVNAGKRFTDLQGSKHNTVLLPIFKSFLDRPKSPTDVNVRESIVIFMGSLAQHLKPSDPQVNVVLKKLLATLSTPSEAVRLSVAQCMSKLVPILNTDEVSNLIKRCLNMAIEGNKTPSERRGGAYGLAGVTRAVGHSAVLQEMHVFDELKKTVEQKPGTSACQGALYSFEILSQLLGRLFEPYVIHILPQLLVCFGDKNPGVRDATRCAARTIMGQLSGQGLRLVLPALLKALGDRSWRTKSGSIELLGSMAFCQPKQLSSCLPTIVPQLFLVLRDSHQNVQKAGKEALQAIGQVIKNPEIQVHVPTLLEALEDPNKYSGKALQALLNTNFVHHIDPASLSLIMPILRRAFNDRNTDIKSQAAKVVGNMSRLTEHKDLKPYLGGLMENIQSVLLDPIPSIRAIAAKAAGSLLKGMGEESFPDLVSWLLQMMQSNSGYIERSGAAQGLASVVANIPEFRFERDILPVILEGSTSDKSYTRQGSITFFQFVPDSWGLPFARYLSQILPCIVRGLADETEFVREAALKAGQAIVTTYSRSAIDLLLPTLEEGVFDNNWRIRQSSIELLGEFLRKVTKSNTKDIKDISEVIGDERGNKILAALYLIRSDVNMPVQQAAISTWKSVVINTPKTVRTIIPVLMKYIISSLGSKNMEKRTLACNSLQDVVKKLGERVLTKIIPILESNLQSDDPIVREACCIGFGEVTSAASRHQITDFLNIIINAIRNALSDQYVEVQEAAAKAIDALYSIVGPRTIDEILPPLIHNLESPDPEISHKALNGLSKLLFVRSNIVLPFVVPKLTKSPMNLFNAKALASVVEVSGSALHPYLQTIIPAYIDSMYTDNLEPIEDFIVCGKRVVVAIQQDGMETLISELIKYIRIDKPKQRLATAYLLGAIIEDNSRKDYTLFISRIISGLLELFADTNQIVETQAVNSLFTVSEKLDKEKITNYLQDINITLDILIRELRNRVTLGRSTVETLGGFNLPNGLDSILPLYLHSLRSGSSTVREQALEGIRYILQLSSTDSLKSNIIIKIIGPLIRIFTEKTLSTNVKCSILKTINFLMDKSGMNLRMGVTQLQTTFVKAISDPATEVREVAAPSLGRLLNFGAKLDFLLRELLRPFGPAMGPIAVSILTAVLSLLENISEQPKIETISLLQKDLLSRLNDNDENIRNTIASCLGSLSRFLSPEDLSNLISTILVPVDSDWRLAHGGLLTLESSFTKSIKAFISNDKIVMNYLNSASQSDKTNIKQSVAKTIAVILKNRWSIDINREHIENELISILIRLLEDTSVDVKVTSLQVVKNTSKYHNDVFIPHLPKIVPIILNHAKERKLVRIKFAGERTLLHLFQLYKDSSILKTYTKSVDVAKAKDVSEFCKKVLSKLDPSDDEGYTAYIDQ